MPEKADVAVNIFAKPFQTALALLSLTRQSGDCINEFWLQFEPVASKHDTVLPYFIAEYLDKEGWSVNVIQPSFWLDLEPIDLSMLADPAYRAGIRYQGALEHSQSHLLFLMHNDVYFFKDILKPMIASIGEAFAIGQIGQCWNCPASRDDLCKDALNRHPCSPDTYLDFKADRNDLLALYAKAHEKGIFARPYDATGFDGEFETQPWPLPECRVNEWACLINLELAKPLCQPYGKLVPPGAYISYAGITLDIGVAWFRQMHNLGYVAKNFNVYKYLKHWIGTGNNTAAKYAYSEDRALKLLQKEFPEYIEWLARKTGRTFKSPH